MTDTAVGSTPTRPKFIGPNGEIGIHVKFRP